MAISQSKGGVTTDLTHYDNPSRPLDVAHTIDRLGRVTTNQYDPIRELIQTTDPLARVTKYGWCTCGGLATLTDANNNTTTWNHDLQGRVTSKVYADTTQIIYTFENTTSRLHNMQDARGTVATYTYNLDNTLQSVAYAPGSGVPTTPAPGVSFTYDTPYNRVLTMTDYTGTTQYAYNTTNQALGFGRLASVTSPIYGTGHTATVTYKKSDGVTSGYDELGRVVGCGIDQSTTNANNVGTTYDALGRVTNVSNALGAFIYGYGDATSRLSTVTYPTSPGLTANYSYYGTTAPTLTGNGDERLQTIQNKVGGTVISEFDYTYNSVGTIATWNQQANGSTAILNTLTYDAADQLTKDDLTGGTTGHNYYGYDPAGNRLNETTATTSSGGLFNSLSQLQAYGTTASQPVAGYVSAPASSVSVDAVTLTPGSGLTNGTNFSTSVPLLNGSNVVTVVAQPSYSTNSPTTQRYGINVTGGTTPASLTYDLNGNCTQDESGNTYTWDALNRLVCIAYPSGTNSGNHTEFAYDGLSRRVQILEKSGLTYQAGSLLTGNASNPSTRNDLWIGSQIAEERDVSNNVAKRFFPQGEQQTVSATTTAYYYTRDHLGSVREMCDGSGTIVSRMAYDSFGRVTVVSGTNLPMFGYADYYQHPASGLDFTIYRPYDAGTGRWLAQDPIGEQGRINLYDYVHNNPIADVDPQGLSCLTNTIFLFDFLTGGGATNRTYGPGDTETKELSGSPGANHLREAFYRNGCRNTSYSYGSGQAAEETLTDPCGTAAQVGGFGGATATNNGNCTVTFHVHNVAGRYSFVYHLVPDRSSPTGPMRSIVQDFYWTEPIDKSRCKCCSK